MATLQLKTLSTTVLLVICFIIFATQGVMARKMQQQAVFLTAAAETVYNNVGKMNNRSISKVEVEAELRIVPSGPDPLHHHRAVPKRPQTP